jgi:hypothetical protein
MRCFNNRILVLNLFGGPRFGDCTRYGSGLRTPNECGEDACPYRDQGKRDPRVGGFLPCAGLDHCD